MADKEKTIVDIVEEVSEEICDKYCKYPEEFKFDEDLMLETVCDKCPLNRL